MKQEIDIHNYNRRLESALGYLKSSDISKKNKELILNFYENCVLEGLSKPHIVKYICELKIIARKIDKNFDKVTKQDIQSFVRFIQEREDISLRQPKRMLISHFRSPPLDIFEGDKGKPSTGDIKANANIIKRTLENFGIGDDIFTMNKNRVIEICGEIKKRQLKVKFSAFTHAGIDDLELYKEMKDAGFESLIVGIESASEEVLKAMDKRQTVAQVKKTIEVIKKSGLKASATFMVGNILETESGLKQTLALAKELHVNGWVSYAQPFPGSRFWQVCAQYGKLINKQPATYWNDRIAFVPQGLSRFKLKYYRNQILSAIGARVPLLTRLKNKIYAVKS